MPKTFRKGMPGFIICMLAVPVAWFIVFYVVVNFNSIILAFRSLDGVSSTGAPIYKWGFDNFAKFFEAFALDTDDVQLSLWNTLKYFALNVLCILPLTFFFAYFMYKKIWGHKFFRVLFYMPSILSAVTMTTLYKNILGGYGPVDEFWKWLTGNPIPAFFTSYELGTPIIMVYQVWVGFGVNMILYQGAMGRIPEEVIEAGKLDGIRSRRWCGARFPRRSSSRLRGCSIQAGPSCCSQTAHSIRLRSTFSSSIRCTAIPNTHTLRRSVSSSPS